jgi:very-short-patch-repair endonuclease
MKSRLVKHAQVLRKNMTDAERLLWSKLRANQSGVKFRRQQPIENYIVDFVCFEQKLIIELDGGQHFESERDTKRDDFLRASGYRILRFWNNEVLRNIEGVLEVIRENITLPLIPSRQGRGNSRGASRQGRGK